MFGGVRDRLGDDYQPGESWYLVERYAGVLQTVVLFVAVRVRGRVPGR